MKASRTGLFVSALPGLLALGLFYSLAIHMHRSLGGWPSSIGEAGFPPALVTHATIATIYFWMLLWVSILTWPVALWICSLDAGLRRFLPYVALYAFALILSIVLMQFAPGPFLYWWRD